MARLVAPKAKSRAKKQAKKVAKAQTAPAARAIRTQIKASRREEKRTAQSDKSLSKALQRALSYGIKDVKATRGMTDRDVAIAVRELAGQREDAAAGNIAQSRDRRREFKDERAELRDQLNDVAQQRGEVFSSTFLDLNQAAQDRAMAKKSLKLDQRASKRADAQLRLDRKAEKRLQKSERFDQKQAKREAREDTDDKSNENRRELLQSFNEALGKARSGDLTFSGNVANDDGSVSRKTFSATSKWAKANREKAIDLIVGKAFEGEGAGRRSLAQAVYERWTESPASPDTQVLMRKLGSRLGFSKDKLAKGPSRRDSGR